MFILIIPQIPTTREAQETHVSAIPSKKDGIVDWSQVGPYLQLNHSYNH